MSTLRVAIERLDQDLAIAFEGALGDPLLAHRLRAHHLQQMLGDAIDHQGADT